MCQHKKVVSWSLCLPDSPRVITDLDVAATHIKIYASVSDKFISMVNKNMDLEI